MQENPGMFFTVVQIGLNAVAILGGIVGDAAFSPAFHSLLCQYMSAELAEQLSFIISFSLVTSLFILFADLTPKRIGMIAPEAVALRIINPMRFCLLSSARWCGSSTAWPTTFSASSSCRWCVKTTSPPTTFMPWWKPARWPGCCVSRNMS
jgi:CBS domain containing-hemolysin-like protein